MSKRRKPYLPDSDVGKRNWMLQFITVLERDPEHFGFTDPRMFEYYQRTIRTYIKAFDALGGGALRSPGLTKAKNQARKEAVKICRDLAMQLKWDSNLTDDEKSSLGLCYEDSRAEKAKLPQGWLAGTMGFPKLAVSCSPNGGHVIRYSDPNSTAKAKPKGVSHMLLFGAIGEKPRMGTAFARLLDVMTKRRMEIMYPVGCGLEGMYVTYYGRWLTTRGELSPWSVGVSSMITDGQVSLNKCTFSHLFSKEGLVDAQKELPAAQKEAYQLGEAEMVRINEDRPMLESAEGDGDVLFKALGQLEAATMRLLDAG